MTNFKVRPTGKMSTIKTSIFIFFDEHRGSLCTLQINYYSKVHFKLTLNVPYLLLLSFSYNLIIYFQTLNWNALLDWELNNCVFHYENQTQKSKKSEIQRE